MNDDIESLPNGDFKVVYKPKSSERHPINLESLVVYCNYIPIFREDFTSQFVLHKDTNQIYYVKSESNYGSEPHCLAITLKNYLLDSKHPIEYDENFRKDELELIRLDSKTLKEILVQKLSCQVWIDRADSIIRGGI